MLVGEKVMQRDSVLSAGHFKVLLKDLGKHLNCKRVLAVICFLILVIVAFRFYHMSVTGYMLPDELYYYERIVLDQELIEGRELFSGIYALFFGGVRNVSSLALMGALYASIWGVGSAFLSYKITRRLGMTSGQASLLLVSLLLFPVYTIMLPMLLTETMALFFALAGIFFILRFHQRGTWVDALFSSLAFVAAYKMREPYILFGVANLIEVLVSNKRSARSLLAYSIPLALVLPVPVSVWPLRFGQPVYASLLGFWPQTSNPMVASLKASKAPAVPRSISESRVLQGEYLSSFLYAFAIGLFFGYNPIFAVLALVSVFLAIRAGLARRRGATRFPTWNALAGLGAYAGSLLFLVYPATGLIPAWTSTAIRATHVSLPVAFTFSYSFRKIGTKNVVAILLVLLVVGSTQLPVITQAVQTNLTRAGGAVDRLNLDYRAPYYRLYELAENSGRTIVFARSLRGARTYLSMLPNVQVWRVPANESQFNTLLVKGWDTIYLYDNYYTVADPSSLELYPQYYRDILVSRSYLGYTIQTLWVDAESYAFKMTRVEST